MTNETIKNTKYKRHYTYNKWPMKHLPNFSQLQVSDKYNINMF